MKILANRAIAAAAAAAIALTAFSAPASARHFGSRAMLGAVAGIFGTIAALAAADAARSNGYYAPYYGPGRYAPPPAPYYGPYRSHHWNGW